MHLAIHSHSPFPLPLSLSLSLSLYIYIYIYIYIYRRVNKAEAGVGPRHKPILVKYPPFSVFGRYLRYTNFGMSLQMKGFGASASCRSTLPNIDHLRRRMYP